MARNESGEHAPGGQKPLGSDAHGQNGRLGILGQRELILGAFETETAERPSQGRIRFGKRLAADGKGLSQGFSHADFL